MTKLRDDGAQLSLCFDHSGSCASEIDLESARISNVVSLDFSRRNIVASRNTSDLEEKKILESVLSEAKKLKW